MNAKFRMKARRYFRFTLRVLTLVTLVVNAVAIPIVTVQAQSGEEVGLISYWDFDEGSGPTAGDTASAGYGNIGDLTNGPQWVSSQFGSALEFNAAADQYVSTLNNDDSLSIPSGGITITAWINAYDVSGVRNILAKDKEAVTARGNYSLAIFEGRLRFGFSETPDPYDEENDYGDNWIDTQTSISPNRWYFVAVTHTYGNSGETAIYIDGVSQPLSAWQCDYGCDPDSMPATFPDPLYIGRSICDGWQFEGLIDEVRIYNRVLSPEEFEYTPIDQPSYNPDITFFTAWNGFVTGDWPLNIPIQLSVDDLDPSTSPDFTVTVYVGENPDEPGRTRLIYDFPEDVVIQPGYAITLDNGTVSKSLVVSSIQITDVNMDTDVVSGTSEPSVNVQVDIEGSNAIRYVTSDGAGNWSADFSQTSEAGDGSDIIHDIGPGSNINASVGDEDGDSTYAEWNIPNPTFTVRLTENQIHGYEWMLGSDVTLLVGGNEIGTQTVEVANWDPNQTFVLFDLGESLTLQAGQLIKMTDGVSTKIHTVTNLAVAGVDIDADTVSGTADPDSQVDVGHIYCDENGCVGFRRVFADYDTREWMADFSVVGEDDDEQDIIDITRGMGSEARQCDEDGDCTQYGWYVPDPYLHVFVTQDRIEAHDWPFGNEVTLTIENPNTPESPDYTESRTVGSASWNPNENVAEFDLNGIYHYQTGDIITVTDGTLIKVHTVRAVTVTNINVVAETISGTANSGTEVYVEIHRPDGTYRVATADGEDQWTVDFSTPWNDQGAYDLTPGLDGAAMLYDPDGDASRADWHVSNPRFAVRANQDMVEANEWELGQTLTLEIDSPGNGEGVDYMTTQDVGQAPWDETQTYAEFHLEGEYEIQPGDLVSVTDEIVTKTHIVKNIEITGFDVEQDIVYGVGDPDSFIDQVWVCNNDGYCVLRHVVVDSDGYWRANYQLPGSEEDEQETFDIVNGTWMDAQQGDEDGDFTFFGMGVPNPTFGVRANTDQIEGWEWQLGTTVTITVDDLGTPELDPDITRTADVYEAPWNPDEHRFDLDLHGEIDILPGFVVTVTDGATTKQLTVSDFMITGYDLDTDMVYGEAGDNQYVNVWTCWQDEPCINRDETADENGDWSTSFAVSGEQDWEQETTDLRGGSWIDSSVSDDDGDQVLFGVNVPNPNITAFPVDEAVEAWEWPEGNTVHLAIDDLNTTQSPDFEQDRIAAVTTWGDPRTYVRFDFYDEYDLKVGDLVTITDGSTQRSHEVLVLSLTDVNPTNDTITGLAEPGSTVVVWPHEYDQGATLEVEAGLNGVWVADYTGLFDLEPGTGGRSQILDEMGNATAVDWNVLSYTLHSVPTHPEVHGHDWAPGSDVTLIIDDDTDPNNGTLYEATRNVYDDPWCGEPCFDLNGVFDLQVGQYVTMTDGNISRTVQVSVLTITEVDYENDTLRGEADPGSRVAVNIWSQDGLARYVTTESDGTWEADFSILGDEDFEQFTTDINHGDNGRAIQLNLDGNDDGTLEYWTAGSTLSGTVYLIEVAPENAIGGVMIEACRLDNFCRTTLTDGSGNYWLDGLPVGTYNLRAISPGTNLPGNLGPIDISYDEDLFGQDIIVPEPPLPPPPDAIEPAHTGGGTTAVYWWDDLTLTASGCSGGTANFEITVLDDGYAIIGPMTESPIGSGSYIATISPLYPHHGTAQITYTITCPDESTVETAFFIYIDPSGVVLNTLGTPVSDATVTLLYSDNSEGPFTEVPDGSVIMSPSNRNNPDITDENGQFGWDVVAGFYKARAEKAGCVSPDDPTQAFVESEVLTIPPPVTDLVLILKCPSPPMDVVITAPVAPVSITDFVSVQVSFNDLDENDDHAIVIEWGDGSSSNISTTGQVGAAVHPYLSPGVYTLTAEVTDSAGESAQAIYQFVVIYDPDGGFVTGGGWIDSPTGAYVADSTLTGKASFGFVSRYQKGANVPTGNTEFQFKVASLNFKSTTYDWLVVAGTKAQYKGTGTINGAGNYGFMLTATDGSPDKFRIKIWDASTGEVIYDNQLGASNTADPTTVIQGGSIVIHKAK